MEGEIPSTPRVRERPLIGSVTSLRRLGQRLRSWLRRFERAVGVERPGRSAWVWLGPLANFLGTVGVVIWFARIGELEMTAAVPLAIFGGLFMAGTAIAYMGAFGADPDDSEAEAG
jgi:hypothetical protein